MEVLRLMSRYKSVLYSLMSGVFVVLFPILSGFIATICNISAPYVYYLQAGFMTIPLIVFLIVIKNKKIDCKKMGYGKINWNKRMLFYLPSLLVFIPVAVKGFEGKDLGSFFGILLLYLMVGIVEEVYYRGVAKHFLDKNFSIMPAIIISSLIFGLGHTSSFMMSNDVLETLLVVLNALIFGFMATCLLYLTNTIYPLMLIHFLFDFESKFILLSGNELFIAEMIRGTFMFIYTLVLLYFINKKEMIRN